MSKRSRGRNVNTLGLLIALETLLPAVSLGLDLAGFTRCISAEGQGPICRLDAGEYSISTTLQIGRPNITVKGTLVISRGDTVLRRAPGFKGALLSDPFGDAPILNSITIRDFTFDGNRGQQNGASDYYDVLIATTRSVLVANCDFINSAGVGLEVRQAVSGIAVNNSYFGNPAVLGVGLGPNTPMPAQTQYDLCGTYVLPVDVAIANSTFEDAGANAIWAHARRLRILNNVFRHNHKDAPFNSSGGQIGLEYCSDNVAVVSNTFRDGPITPNGYWADGIEVEASDVTVVDNLVTNNAGAGMILHSVQEFFTANWDPATGVIANNKMGYCCFGGIAVYNHNGWRPTNSLVIDNAILMDGNEYGIEFTNESANAPINHVAITNNCLRGNLNGDMRMADVGGAGFGSEIVIANNQTSNCGPK